MTLAALASQWADRVRARRPAVQPAPPPSGPRAIPQPIAKPTPKLRSLLTPKVDERTLAQRYQAGDNAAGVALLAMHKGLIYKYARPYFKRGADEEDLLQEAKMGFLDGVQKFDLSQPVKVSTYALHWARHYARRCMENTCSLIRVPVHAQEAMSKNYHANKTGDVEQSVIVALGRTARRVFSLDAVMDNGEGEGSSHYDVTPDDHPSPEAVVSEAHDGNQNSKDLEIAMATLTERERIIMLARSNDQTLADIGNRFSLSREGVRQIEMRALKKLRLYFAKIRALT